jgi:hypothetical protein
MLQVGLMLGVTVAETKGVWVSLGVAVGEAVSVLTGLAV